MKEYKDAYLISRANSSEYNELATIWESSVRATHSFLREEDISFFMPLILNQYLKNLQLYYVKIDTAIAGFIGITGKNIEMLFIAPEHMGKGIGKSLLNYAIRQHGCNRVDVNEQNFKALSFYRNNGFNILGRSEIDGTGKPYPLLHLELEF